MIKHWFQLIRPLNLFIIALTQYFINIFFLIPHFNTYGILFSLNAFQFFLLVISTVFICTAGYIINDYFDIQVDQINKPEKQLIGKVISKRAALNAYLILSFMGLVIGIYLSWVVGFIQAATIQGISILLLYFYSSTYKKIAMLGNIVVAFLTACSLLVVVAFEPHLFQLQRPGDYYIAGYIWKVVLVFSIFAFVMTFIREVIKDIEDMDGDTNGNVKSIPIMWGMKAAKICIIMSSLFLISLLAYFGIGGEQMITIFTGILIALIAMLIFLCIKASSKIHFHRLSFFAKCIMLTGICFFPIQYFIYF